ncbi:tetratricopeptide repeat protein [Novipirellula artificiosorum]|uniref:Tetratricopeptide repeat protein n=1 Tax=Novipirellula artificiosorum TaxID=2528016 RepID=A0A5C6DF03_9BACT|nr:RNA polymerase subunit sigma-24 [Novipirellula artificiosorum]TWU34331.1 hypothetical protein Poly41_44780 [Novipirellula artificiosorum]
MISNPLPLLFPLLFLTFSAATCFAADAHSIARLGGQMDAKAKTTVEQQVAKNPQDIESRTKLLGYYFMNGRMDPDAKSEKRRHVLWLIKNAPESEILGLPYSLLDKHLDPEGYGNAREAWLKLTEQSKNLQVLANASQFFLLGDRSIAEELLRKGQRLDAENPSWSKSLGQLYSLGLFSVTDQGQRKQLAEKAFQQFDIAYHRSSTIEKDSLLESLAKSALEAGRMDDAKRFAEEMLENDEAGWNRGNRIHHGNLTLGRIALREGDVNEAKSRLLSAGKTPGSPQLNSFGPNMQLAKELLEQGETEVVLEYFALCDKFWKSPQRKLEQWIEDVKANRTPQFGGNLAY